MLIIATVGPKTTERRVLRDIIQGGANVLRLNFSHGNIEEFEHVLGIARGVKKDIHILQDLSGSKIRVSNKLSYILRIYNGEEVLFCGEDMYGQDKLKSKLGYKKVIPLNLNSSNLISKSFNEISMKDNTMLFKIISFNETGIVAKVIRGGIIRAGKGCNILGFLREDLELSLKDKEDIKWGVKNKVDIICQSFVEKVEDIKELKAYIKCLSSKEYRPKIWAKIETPKGIENIDAIVDEVDGVLIGRGDLIPEGSLISAPIFEEKIYKSAITYKKDIIIGTHLLNSMKNGYGPTLPEVESIYFHMKLGVKGFLLAGETSIGKAPIKTVEFLKKLVDKYEGIVEI